MPLPIVTEDSAHMTTRILTASFLLILSSALDAAPIPSSVVEICTTSKDIYYETEIRASATISKADKTSAVKRALGVSESNPKFTTHTFQGQWFYEFENDDAIFAGYKVRAHYLNVAIVTTDEGVSTIICNSSNLDQKMRSIHRKAPLWKGSLDSNIRIELGRAGEHGDRTHRTESSLQQLLRDGVITRAEYDELLARSRSE